MKAGHQLIRNACLRDANERRCRAQPVFGHLNLCSLMQLSTRTIRTCLPLLFSGLIAPRDAGKRTSAAQRGSQPRPGEQPQLLAFVAAEAKEKALPPFVGRSTTPLDNGQRLNTRTRSTEPRTASTKKALHSAKVSPTPRQPSKHALRPLRHGAPALRTTTKTASAGPRLARRVGAL